MHQKHGKIRHYDQHYTSGHPRAFVPPHLRWGHGEPQPSPISQTIQGPYDSMNQWKLLNLFWPYLTEPHWWGKMSYQSHYKELIKTFFTRDTQTWDKTITFREQRHNHLWISVMVISASTLRSYSSWRRTSWFVWQSPESVRSKPVVSFSCSPPICHEQQLLN